MATKSGGDGATARRPWGRRVVVALVILAALIGAGAWIYPRAVVALTTVSTDDAYVNGHVTFVAPRIGETVRRVLVDETAVVRKGDLLVVLDDAMWKVRVAQAEAALRVAREQLGQATAGARAQVASAKASRYRLAAAITQVKDQAAALRGAVARLDASRAAEALAKAESRRYSEAARTGSVTKEQADIRRTDLEQAQARTRAALEDVRRARVGLELPEEPPDGRPLDEVPKDQDQRHSSVLAALGALSLDLARLGVELPGYYATPDEFIAKVRKMAPDGDIDRLIDLTVQASPAVATARAQVDEAVQNLAQARLNLGYCRVVADIDGVVSNRNVNPGDIVAQGQRLMAIRSLEDIWIDANFKETQLGPVRIGHPVDILVDAYPGVVFKGRVAGFSPGTGSATSLFPAQNATGNFVKIVQRLPVRIELVGPNPADTPLLVGLSVEPRVLVRQPPQGPDAGRRLPVAARAAEAGDARLTPRGGPPPPPPTSASAAPGG